jgi:hypothetical protein
MVKYVSRTLRSSALSSLTSQRIIFDSATMPLARSQPHGMDAEGVCRGTLYWPLPSNRGECGVDR